MMSPLTGSLGPLGRARGIFDPSQVAGLVGWWKADAITGLADGAAVASWLDSSAGSTNPAVQATGGLQPLYKASWKNGRPAVQFTASRLLTVASLALGTFTIFTVFQASGGNLLYEHSANANGNFGSYLNVDTGATIYVHRAGGTDWHNLTTGWGTTNVAQLATHRHGGTDVTHTLARNGVVQTLTGGTSADVGTTTATTTFNIGARNGGSAGVTGYIAEILAYSPLVSAPNQASIENYLRLKYALY